MELNMEYRYTLNKTIKGFDIIGASIRCILDSTVDNSILCSNSTGIVSWWIYISDLKEVSDLVREMYPKER